MPALIKPNKTYLYLQTSPQAGIRGGHRELNCGSFLAPKSLAPTPASR